MRIYDFVPSGGHSRKCTDQLQYKHTVQPVKRAVEMVGISRQEANRRRMCVILSLNLYLLLEYKYDLDISPYVSHEWHDNKYHT